MQYTIFSSSTKTAFSTVKRRFLHGEDSILNKTQGGGSGGMCLGGEGLGGGRFARLGSCAGIRCDCVVWFVLRRAFLWRAEEERAEGAVVWIFRFMI